MWCESGGSYSAQNPTSSARGKYQLLDTTYAEWCVACNWSKDDQDRAAHDLYAAVGGSPWACA
jgi:muramidase (phage lysozyme)